MILNDSCGFKFFRESISNCIICDINHMNNRLLFFVIKIWNRIDLSVEKSIKVRL